MKSAQPAILSIDAGSALLPSKFACFIILSVVPDHREHARKLIVIKGYRFRCALRMRQIDEGHLIA